MTPHDTTLMTLVTSMAQVTRAYRAAVDKVASEYGLSQATGLPVLLMSRIGNEVRSGVLAETIGVEASTLVRVVDQLIAQGLVERREDPLDRRARNLHLTEEGRARAAAMERALLPFRRKLFEHIAPADIAACQRLLDGLGAAIAATGHTGPARKHT